MFFRVRVAFGIALLLILVTALTVFAKGGFSFITISGPKLKEEVRATDPALTADFFAFADFYRDGTKEPADPGTAYEITRFYVDARGETPFDRLHYYPETGFVYYDGLVNGGSEYDGKWYIAKPEIRRTFESILGIAPVAQQPVSSAEQPKPRPSLFQTQWITLIAITAGLAALLMLATLLRKPSNQ